MLICCKIERAEKYGAELIEVVALGILTAASSRESGGSGVAASNAPTDSTFEAYRTTMSPLSLTLTQPAQKGKVLSGTIAFVK